MRSFLRSPRLRADTAPFKLAVAFLDANTAVAVGYFGAIIRTTDGGPTWTRENSRTSSSIQGVFIFDPSTAFVAADGYIRLGP